MLKLCLAITILLIVLSCNGFDKTEDTLRKAEPKLILPAGASPMSWYDRYYVIHGDRAAGIFIINDSHSGKMKVVQSEQNLPYRADGGCSVVRVQLDLATSSWDTPFCHG